MTRSTLKMLIFRIRSRKIYIQTNNSTLSKPSLPLILSTYSFATSRTLSSVK